MSTPHARNIVRKLLSVNSAMRIQDLYARGLSEFPATPFPHPPPPKRYPAKGGGLKPFPAPAPNPGHPFRSRSYLKDKVLPDLIAAGEVIKAHEIVEPAPGVTPPKRRSTRSKGAMDSGGVDIWRWRLAGPQAEAPEPLLEQEPTPTSHDWYLPNELFPVTNPKAIKQKEDNDTYGARRWDHLNTRRQEGRPEKLRREKAWVREIQKARYEGIQAAETR